MYRTTCEQNYRIKLACDDFIEAVNKFKLLKSRQILEDNKKKRQKKLKKKNGEIVVDSPKEVKSYMRMNSGKSNKNHTPTNAETKHGP